MAPTTPPQRSSGLHALIITALVLLIIFLGLTIVRMVVNNDSQSGSNPDPTCTVPNKGHEFLGGAQVPQSMASDFGAVCK